MSTWPRNLIFPVGFPLIVLFFPYCSQDVGPTVVEFWTSLLHGRGQVFPIGQLLNVLILWLQICLLGTEWEQLVSVGACYIKSLLHLTFFFMDTSLEHSYTGTNEVLLSLICSVFHLCHHKKRISLLIALYLCINHSS